MKHWDSLDRKALVTTLGTAGLGLGLIVATTGGAPGASAQETSTPVVAQGKSESGEGDIRVRPRSDEMREELYAQFTAALADELGIGNVDKVDAAIRVAMMTLVDARVDDGLFTAGQAEALKVLIATADVPLGPGPMFGPPPGALFRDGHWRADNHRFFPIRHGDQDWIIRVDDGSRADEGDDGDARPDEAASEDTSQANKNDASA